MSGAGKAAAARTFEDIGFTVVDNVAPNLLPAVVEHSAHSGVMQVAIVTDARSGDEFEGLLPVVEVLRREYARLTLLFLDASDQVLVQRFKETRRKHPLYSPQGGILPSIEREREMLSKAREAADKTIDTSALAPSELRAILEASFSPGTDAEQKMTITVVSFGFKHGLPLDADLVFDVRFLRNPHYVDALRPFDGRDKAVRDYVFDDPDTGPLLGKLYDLIDFSLPRYLHEGKAYLTIAIGCTGGRHRSVAISEALAGMLRDKGYRVFVQHRDIPQYETHGAVPEEREGDCASPPAAS